MIRGGDDRDRDGPAGGADVALAFVLQMPLGALAGYAMGRLMVALVNRTRLECPGVVTSAFLKLVARPLAVFLTLLPTRMSVREQAMVAWVGLRGAVPIILATFPLLAGVAEADRLFHLVFFVVLASVLLQGTSIPFVARWLGVDAPLPERGPALLETHLAGSRQARLQEIRVGDGMSGRPP